MGEDKSAAKSDWYGSEETFFHEQFQMDNPELLDDMECLKIEKTSCVVNKTQPRHISKLSNSPALVSLPKTKAVGPTMTKRAAPSVRRSAEEAFNNANAMLLSVQPAHKRLRTVERTNNANVNAANFNAAIEAEVARRVRQEMAVVRLSEQRAFFMMEQQRIKERQQQQQAELAIYHRQMLLKRAFSNYSVNAAHQNKGLKRGIFDYNSALLKRLPSERNVISRMV